MNTIRLTYSPYGSNRVLKVTPPQQSTDETEDGEAMDFEPKVVEHSRSRKFNPEDDEL